MASRPADLLAYRRNPWSYLSAAARWCALDQLEPRGRRGLHELRAAHARRCVHTYTMRIPTGCGIEPDAPACRMRRLERRRREAPARFTPATAC